MITVTITTPRGPQTQDFETVEQAHRAFEHAYESARQAGRVTHVQFSGPPGPIMSAQWPPRTADSLARRAEIITPLDEDYYFENEV